MNDMKRKTIRKPEVRPFGTGTGITRVATRFARDCARLRARLEMNLPKDGRVSATRRRKNKPANNSTMSVIS